MNPDPFERFSAIEREELALCGIFSAEQLCKCKASRIAGDLRKAREFFPERRFVLTQERLEAMQQELHTVPCESDTAKHTVRVASHAKGNCLPTTGFLHHSAKLEDEITSSLRKHQAILHTPVRSTHPWMAIFAALSTLLLVVPVVSVPFLIFMIVTQTVPENLPIVLHLLAGGAIVLPVILYLFFARMAICPVCHIRVFRFQPYTRNRAAHHFPLLGYNMSTALHLLFRAFYVCPGCGTPIKLRGSKE